MRFSLNRELLLKPLLLVSGAVERKSTLPILGNILFDVKGQSLTLTATDLELEMVVLAWTAIETLINNFFDEGE